MVIERGASNTLVVMGRVTLSPSYWLLHFTDIERGGNAYCVVQAGNSSASFISLTFTETTSPVALDGEVLLSPPGNWNLKIYEQTSSTNLVPASAGRLVKDVDVFVDGAGVADSGWTETCPTEEECDPLSVRVNGEPYGTVADPCGGVASVTVNQGGVPVGSLVGGVWVVPECPACDDLTVEVNGTEYSTVVDPCGATASVDVEDSDGNPVGSLVGGVWVVPTLCDLIGDVAAVDIETEVIDCMDDDQKAAANVATTCDLDAQLWIAQVEAIDGQVLEAGVRKAVCDLVTGLKADGIWTKLKAVGLMSVARTFDAAFVPLKGTAPTAFNFVSGDYDRKTGLVGNGSSKYLNTNRNNNADPQDDQAIGVWVHTATQAGEILIGAGSSQTGTINIGRRPAPNDSEMFLRNRSSTRDDIASVGTATGYIGASRISSTGYTFRANGATISITQASQTPYNGNIGVFASIGPFSYSSARIRFYHIGEGITLADLDSRLSTFFTAVDAIMP